MVYKVEINIGNHKNILKSKVKKALLERGEDTKVEVDKNTPEDTKVLVGNNKVSEITEDGKTLMIQVYNNTEYATFVENGVLGRKYNYHKPRGVVKFSGVGAKMFKKAHFTQSENLKPLILKKLGKKKK